ncbi:MAG: DUF3179 domain-containing protein [Methyloligellaceae bacterium]
MSIRNRLWAALCLPFLMLLLWMSAGMAFASPERWRAEGWTKTDFSKTSVKFDEILSGGPPKDGIPSIDKPKFIPVKEEKEVGATEPVVGFALNGDARAYPLRILMWHEIVNDVVGGVPVTVTYCPLCNSAIVFDRRLDGKVLDFGTTGKLRNSDLVMYDRQTESWWQQFTGTGIIGTYTGRQLATFPARLESFERFKARHPDGKVLVPNIPSMRAYGRNPYVNYDLATRPFLYSGDLPEGINPMARVVVVYDGKESSAVSLDLLRRKGSLTLGATTLKWEPGQNSALEKEKISEGRDVGNVIARKKTAQGEVDVRYDVTFAFVYHAFHPERTILKN